MSEGKRERLSLERGYLLREPGETEKAGETHSKRETETEEFKSEEKDSENET